MKSQIAFGGIAFVLIVFLFLFFFGFNFGSNVPVSDPRDLTVEQTTTPFKTGEEAFQITGSRYAVASTASSFLPYDASAHLAYDPYLSYDENWKTAWCTAEDLPSVTLTFEESTDLGSVGIVPGYAVNEDLFFKNARLKKVAISYNGSEQVDGADDVLTFEDRYAMQFFDLNVRDVQSVSFRVLEVYPGSKYSDLCLAEVDFWSDFVKDQDAEAALAAGLDPSESAQTCENGDPYPSDSMLEEFRSGPPLEPTSITDAGAAYFMPDWGVGFTIVPKYETYRVFYHKDDYSDSLSFAETSDSACLPYGDAMGIYLSKGDFEAEFGEETPEYLTKGSFSLGALSGHTYREDWFGGDILSYAFSLKNTAFHAASLACRLDEEECEELEPEAFIKSLLSTLH